MSAVWGPEDLGRVPLFDRLIDEDRGHGREAVPLRTLSPSGLRASIQREIERVLGTRCTFTGDVALARDRTILDYGLPDLDQGGRALIAERRSRLAKLVEHTLLAFEPRLSNLRVEVTDTGEGSARAVISLEADVQIGRDREPFALSLPIGGGRVG